MSNTPKLSLSEAKKVIKNARREIKNYFETYGITYAIFGKSMGIDSSVIAGLFSDIPGIKPIGAIMPIESDPEDLRIAKIVLDHFKIPSIKVDLTEDYHKVAGSFYATGSVRDQLTEVFTKYEDGALIGKMAERKAHALGNIKARLRMITLYHIAQLTGGIIISTDNYSEWWMGFWTLNGDVGDFSPIQQIFKSRELYSVASALGVPKESIKAKPTDGLDIIPGGGDEDQLGLPYDDLDDVIVELLKADYDSDRLTIEKKNTKLFKAIAKKTDLSEGAVAQVAYQMRNTHYKRRVPVQIDRSKLGLPKI